MSKCFSIVYHKYVTLLCLIIICVIIFLFSHQTGEASSHIASNILVRKLGHFTEYAALGFFMLGFLSNVNRLSTNTFNLLLVSLFFSFLYAVSDEFHQTFIPNRSGNITDVFIDTSGAFFGIVISLIILKKYKIKNF